MTAIRADRPRRARRVARDLTLNTVLCISLAARPSNIGTRFHNYLYDELGLDFVYKAFSTTNLRDAVTGIRGLGIRGCGLSMPYKEQCMPLLDRIDRSAYVIGSVNTIVNDDGLLTGYNTDYLAVVTLLAEHEVPVDAPTVIRGSGGIAKAVAAALQDTGFTDVTVAARNAATGKALAQAHDFAWTDDIDSIDASVLINVTPIGMLGGGEASALSFPEALVDRAAVVFDVVALPPDTPLIQRAQSAGARTITGAELIALQAAEQFVLYTGVRPSIEQIRAASEYSRM